MYVVMSPWLQTLAVIFIIDFKVFSLACKYLYGSLLQDVHLSSDCLSGNPMSTDSWKYYLGFETNNYIVHFKPVTYIQEFDSNRLPYNFSYYLHFIVYVLHKDRETR